jgi:hypothetical protein
MAISTSSMNGDLLVDEDAEVCTMVKKTNMSPVARKVNVRLMLRIYRKSDSSIKREAGRRVRRVMAVRGGRH